MLGIWEYTDSLPSDLDSGDVLTAVLLFDRANTRTRICWPSIPQLAKARRSSSKTARESVKRLIERGIVSVIEKGKGHKANKYLVPDLTPTGGQTSRHREPNLHVPSPARPDPNLDDRFPWIRHEPKPPHSDASPQELADFDDLYAKYVKNNRESRQNTRSTVEMARK